MDAKQVGPELWLDMAEQPVGVGDTLLHFSILGSSLYAKRCVVVGFTKKMLKVRFDMKTCYYESTISNNFVKVPA